MKEDKNKMIFQTKKKQTTRQIHRYREQTEGYQKGGDWRAKWVKGVNYMMTFGDKHIIMYSYLEL